MFGAPAKARDWDESPEADHAPTLAPAPEGLSARRVERWLDLPPGAWQRRRLYALRLKGNAFASLGLQPGDLAIVEPGAREQPGHLVVLRGSAGLSLTRLPGPHPVERRMPTVLELPLRERRSAPGERVVGTVIGLLRPTGTGALRPVSLSMAKPRQKRTLRPTVTPIARQVAAPLSPELDDLYGIRANWQDWLLARKESGHWSVTPAQLERWERLDASLSTLCACLERTHNPGLRSALAAETSALVSTIRGEMGR